LQRQFDACKRADNNSNFDEELLGKSFQISDPASITAEDDWVDDLIEELLGKSFQINDAVSGSAEEDGHATSVDTSGARSSNDTDACETCAEEAERLNYMSKIEMPTLNDAQQKAANDFLSAKDGRIRIVQG
jgi:hypothetical protein